MRARFPAFLSLVLLVSLTAGFAGCNTIEGLGQDIQAGGRKIERAAEKARK